MTATVEPTSEQLVLLEIVKALDQMMGKLGAVQARCVRIETRVSKIAMRLGLTHEGETIDAELPEVKVIFTTARCAVVEPMSVHP